MSKYDVRRSERGAVLVEFTVGSLLFFLTLITGIELSVILYHQARLNDATLRAARWGITGEQLPSQFPTVLLTREDSVRAKLIEWANAYGVPIIGSQIQICPASNFQCTPANESIGGPTDFFNLRAQIQYQTPFGPISIRSSVIVRSEDYA